ncbi:DUF3105 domain-containing protein [Prauserella oleivorans]
MVAYKPKPWGTIAAAVAILALAGVVFGYAMVKLSAKNDRVEALAAWTPSEDNRDPSTKIAGVVTKDYPSRDHIKATQRVAYDLNPAFGGAHDGAWAECRGTVYSTPVRTENLVHSLEHGAVWVAYNPDDVYGDALDLLKQQVSGRQYTLLSPHPGLEEAVSLQAWGRQLKVGGVGDARIEQFIQALAGNRYTAPEPGPPARLRLASSTSTIRRPSTRPRLDPMLCR